jgi:hypothetical protein
MAGSLKAVPTFASWEPEVGLHVGFQYPTISGAIE